MGSSLYEITLLTGAKCENRLADERYGEELCAWVIPQDGAALGEEDVRAFCRDRISHQKIPRYVRFVTEFPMTVTGKVQKFVMRERMEEELGLRRPPAV